MDEFALKCLGDRAGLRHIRPGSQLAGVAVKGEVVRAAGGHRLKGSERQLCPVVEIPIFLRRNERQMRTQESNREEERLLCFRKLPDLRRSGARHRTVVVGVVGNVLALHRRPLRAGCGSGESLLRACVLITGRLAETAGSFIKPTHIRNRPRSGVVSVVHGSTIEDLAHGAGKEAVVLEVLRQRDDVREALAQKVVLLRGIDHDVRGIRPQTCEQTEARRRAE